MSGKSMMKVGGEGGESGWLWEASVWNLWNFGMGRSFKDEVNDIIAGMATLKNPVDSYKSYNPDGTVDKKKKFGKYEQPMNQLPIFVNLDRSAKQAFLFRKLYKTLNISKKKVYDEKHNITEKQVHIANITYEQILKLCEIFITYEKKTEYSEDDYKKFVQMIVDDAAENSEDITFYYDKYAKYVKSKKENYNNGTIATASKADTQTKMKTLDDILSSYKRIPPGSIFLPTKTEDTEKSSFAITNQNLFILTPAGEIFNQTKFMGTKGGYTLSWDPSKNKFDFVKKGFFNKTQKNQPAAPAAAPAAASPAASPAPAPAPASAEEPTKGGRRTRKNRY